MASNPTTLAPWIENVSMADIINGIHYDPGPRSMLIQIVDPDTDWPTPKFKFSEVHQFQFLDLADEDNQDESLKIQPTQARSLVLLLDRALRENLNVVVHCHAGMCRSGAVVEVGVIMGFRDTEKPRIPNLRVKRLMSREITTDMI